MPRRDSGSRNRRSAPDAGFGRDAARLHPHPGSGARGPQDRGSRTSRWTQIDSQIAVLNRDFRKTNRGRRNTPAPFAPIAGDARMEFELARTDPDGSPTDGVIRVADHQDSFTSDDPGEVRRVSGGSDAWPRDEYLNMWVCQLTGGLLGYAQFPGGPAETDGVVMTHTGFGTTGTAAAPFNNGRTATHEIGHWLNLRHIWGDDGDGCSARTSSTTRRTRAGRTAASRPSRRSRCSNGPNGDMFMNYMDYVDDDTMVMFTAGPDHPHAGRLDGPRSSIGSSISCGPTGPKPIKEFPKDIIKEPPKELPKDPPKDFPKDPPKDFPKDPRRTSPRIRRRNSPRIRRRSSRRTSKEPPKDFPKDPPRSCRRILLDPPKRSLSRRRGAGASVRATFPAGATRSTDPAVRAQPFVLATGTGGPCRADAGPSAYAHLLRQYCRAASARTARRPGYAAWQQGMRGLPPAGRQ